MTTVAALATAWTPARARRPSPPGAACPSPRIAGAPRPRGFRRGHARHAARPHRPAATIRAIPLIAAAGKPAIARIPVGEFATASRLLDAGVSGVIAPMINTIEDARRFGGFMKYPPLGRAELGAAWRASPSRGLSPGDYFAKANGFSLTFAMIETREALAIIDDILAAPGIDGIFIGPSDLSIGLSKGATVDPTSPEVDEALDHALQRARAAGRSPRSLRIRESGPASSPGRAIDLVALANDTILLRAGAQAALKAARG